MEIILKFFITLFLGMMFTFGSTENTLVDQIRARGELRVVTKNSPTTYYEGPNGETGLEFDLAQRFAQFLGVKLKLIVVDEMADIFTLVVKQQVDLAAAGIAGSNENKPLVRFGPGYQTITPQLVYYKGSTVPTTLEELNHQHVLRVIQGESHVDLLKRLKKHYPQLTWKELPDIESTELLEQVWERKINYAVANSNEVAQIRQYLPELQVGFDLSEPRTIAWMFPRFTEDDSLYMASIQCFNFLKRSGELEQLIDRYYGHIEEEFNYPGTMIFHQHIRGRLPIYRKEFEQAAFRYSLDWQLIAAISYQESHWNPDAVSGTGVRGLMMLTRMTAQEMGVRNRENPLESIEGGAKYFLMIKNRMGKHIQEPDKTWLSLAAYNVGYNHLVDAQIMTRQFGGNPHRWADVKKYLPLLAQKKWYVNTQYGYARGYEAVEFVRNIRRYYDILNCLDKKPPLPSGPPENDWSASTMSPML